METLPSQTPKSQIFLPIHKPDTSADPSLTTNLKTSCRGSIINSNSRLKELQPQQKWSNIYHMHTDKKTIKERTQREELRYASPAIKADTELYVIQQDTYTQVALDHLSDANTYQKVPRISARTVENKVNTAWKKVCQQNKIPPFVQKKLPCVKHGSEQILPSRQETQTGPDIEIRPIVSNINGPTQHISWLLVNALEPMPKYVPAHLEGSLELIRCIHGQLAISPQKKRYHIHAASIRYPYTAQYPYKKPSPALHIESRTQYSTSPNKTSQTSKSR